MMIWWHRQLAAALLLGIVTMVAYPGVASAQAPQNEQMFNRRMESRVEAVQMRIRRLREDLDGGEVQEERPRSGGYDTNAGIRNRLDALDEQCRELEREIRRMGITNVGTPYDIYEQQQRVEYNVYVLERQVQDLRRWIRPAGEDEEAPADNGPEQPVEPEDGTSDDDWASEWAKSGD
jgi:TolA-binding protein